ncbi:MAG: DUF3109 family protein [Bacteroidota bacterium]
MYIVENQHLSDDIAERFFVCDLLRCKGTCCQEGDLGAPLEKDEMELLEKEYAAIKPYITKAGQRAIEDQGVFILDEEGDFSTPLIEANENECAYAIQDKTGKWSCGIEKAYLDGKTSFRKPISCHLYPIRITHYPDINMDAINYDQWDICSPACDNGKSLGVPVYKFLKEPLIRKYGEAWYAELVQQIEERLGEQN